MGKKKRKTRKFIKYYGKDFVDEYYRKKGLIANEKG